MNQLIEQTIIQIIEFVDTVHCECEERQGNTCETPYLFQTMPDVISSWGLSIWNSDNVVILTAILLQEVYRERSREMDIKRIVANFGQEVADIIKNIFSRSTDADEELQHILMCGWKTRVVKAFSLFYRANIAIRIAQEEGVEQVQRYLGECPQMFIVRAMSFVKDVRRYDQDHNELLQQIQDKSLQALRALKQELNVKKGFKKSPKILVSRLFRKEESFLRLRCYLIKVVPRLWDVTGVFTLTNKCAIILNKFRSLNNYT